MTDNLEDKTRMQDGDDPRSPKLPPLKKRGEGVAGDATTGVIPTAGVSKKLKIFVIALTAITILAFGIFTAMLVKKSASSSKESEAPSAVWDKQILTVAEKLRDAGLYDQALVQYEKYLENPDVDLKTRSNVAYIMGGLYMEMGNCREALAWFYQSEVALSDAPWSEDRNKRIDGCLHQLKSAP